MEISFAEEHAYSFILQISLGAARDLFFAVTADAAGLLVRGGGITVKLIEAVID